MARVKHFIRVYAYYTLPILPHEHSILDAKEIHINVGLELNCINKDQLLYVYTIVFFLSIVMRAKIMELSLSLQSTEKHITF